MPNADALHVALVMDGNGRWAQARGLPRVAGHRAGAHAARRVVEAAADAGIGTLTLFAFSSDNWRRPRSEVARVLALIRRFVRREARASLERGTRLSVIGRRDRLPAGLLRSIEDAERLTRGCTALHVRLAVDYSARDALVAAAARLADEGAGAEATRDTFARALAGGAPAPDVDLFVRPGGERRLSDFLLYESAYAELVFLDTLWPDMEPEDLHAAVAEYRSRDRRFGGVPARRS